MSDNRQTPHDPEAEAALLGALILRPDLMEDVSRITTEGDFYNPANRTIFSTLVHLRENGASTIDTVVLGDALSSSGMLESVGGTGTLLDLMSNAPSTSPASARQWCEIIIRMATYRRAIEAGNDLVEAAYSMARDPNDIVDAAKVDLESIGIHLGEIPADAWQLDEYLARPITDRPQWCIPGIIREGWRVMVVAGEGIGKTVLLRQIAIAAAQGIHPLNFSKQDPCRTLIVDLENPDDSIMDVCTPINERVKGKVKDGYDADRAWLWHRPSGINLRQRPDRVALESIIAKVQPKLVCIGPLYKAYDVSAKENDELAAREIMSVFDDLRTRYKFGLMIEHHAPKESGGNKRKLMPYGSSLWLRWPEIGINLQPTDDSNQELTLGRWRGDRLDNEWPLKITRGGQWEWTGVWDTGHFNNDRRPPEPISEPVSTTPLLPRPGGRSGGAAKLPPRQNYDLDQEPF